jgi:hypothetical protein
VNRLALFLEMGSMRRTGNPVRLRAFVSGDLPDKVALRCVLDSSSASVMPRMVAVASGAVAVFAYRALMRGCTSLAVHFFFRACPSEVMHDAANAHILIIESAGASL